VVGGGAESGRDVPTASICPLCQEILAGGNVMERSAQNGSCHQADKAQLQTRRRGGRVCVAAAVPADTWPLQVAQCPRPRWPGVETLQSSGTVGRWWWWCALHLGSEIWPCRGHFSGREGVLSKRSAATGLLGTDSGRTRQAQKTVTEGGACRHGRRDFSIRTEPTCMQRRPGPSQRVAIRWVCNLVEPLHHAPPPIVLRSIRTSCFVTKTLRSVV
jgi:hypothetical protein